MPEVIDLTNINVIKEKKNLAEFLTAFSSIKDDVMLKFNDDLTVSINEFLHPRMIREVEMCEVKTEVEKKIIERTKDNILGFKQSVSVLKRFGFYDEFIEFIKKRKEDNIKGWGLENYSTDPQGKGCIVNGFNPYTDCLNYYGAHKAARMNPDAIVAGYHGHGGGKKATEATVDASKRCPDAEKYILMGCSTGLREDNNFGFLPDEMSYMEYVCEMTHKPVVAPCGDVIAKARNRFCMEYDSHNPHFKKERIDNIEFDDIGKQEFGYAACEFDKETGHAKMTQFPEFFVSREVARRLTKETKERLANESKERMI